MPSELPSLLGDPDPERAMQARRARQAMKKLDIGAMEEAADGRGRPVDCVASRALS